MRAAAACLILSACTTKPDAVSETDTAQAPLSWPTAPDSLCDNPASIVQIAATLPAGAAPGPRDVVIGLMHGRHGNAADGGHPHWVWRVEGQEMSDTEPAFFEVDMCQGNAIMWSEENCEYNLIVMVDDNGNNSLESRRLARPDEGEYAAVEVFNQSCHHDGAYRFEMTLDCTDGASCVAFDGDPGCDCAEPACPSEAGICWL